MALVGAGVVLGGLPVQAEPVQAEPRVAASARPDQPGLRLLESAARAGRSLTYSGTQYLATWREQDTRAALMDVAHEDGRASVLTAESSAAQGDRLPMTSTAILDPRLLALLAATYDLVVVAPDRCAGRTTDVVEAQRPSGAVAGRFWIDRDSGLLLRRDVFDEQGQRILSSAFVDLEVDGPDDSAEQPGAESEAGAVPGSGPAVASAPALRSAGWRVPEDLPQGFRLFDLRLSDASPEGQILHLAYSDGLSTASLFVQRGRLGSEPPSGFTAQKVDGRPVWVRHEAPERVVWSGEGRVWTLVSDAPPAVVLAAVGALPRDAAPRTGALARVGRGLTRIGSALNPFG